MEKFHIADVPKTDRITHLVDNLYAKMPVIESARAKLITESYKATEGQPVITRRAEAFAHILRNIPIIIRDNELIVGSSTIAPRGCQTFPEFSYQWLEDELDTVATRTADPFYISEQAKADLREVHKYWKGKTTSELATSYMAPEAILAIDHNIFTPGNYFYNGVGHVTVKYEEVLAIGYEGIIAKAQKELDECNVGDGDYAKKSRFLEAVIMSCQAVIDYAHRYAELAEQMAYQCQDPTRKQELLQIASNCTRVPAKGARNFYEACQSFWFVQQLIQMESSGHSISPGRFDQYMYPYYKSDMEAGNLTREFAQELMDCIWVKLNDLNKCRDAASAEGFAGYSLFQNLIVGGQNKDGEDMTNDLSFMCIEASMHVHLPAPSLSIRVWNGSPHDLLIKAAELTRTVFVNDDVAPELNVSELKKTSYKQGDAVELPSYTASDNLGVCTVDVILILPNSELRLLSHDENGSVTYYTKNTDLYLSSFGVSDTSFCAEQTGRYVLRFVAYDDIYNRTVVELPFDVK